MKKDKEPEKKEEIRVQRFTLDNVLTSKELDEMSNGNKKKHIEYLEQVALQLDNALAITVEQLQIRVRAKNGELL